MSTTAEPKPRKPKLTTMEKRAVEMCAAIKSALDPAMNPNSTFSFGIEWRRSAMWRFNPVILWHGEKACCVTGCGFDKLSQALADVLHPLGKDEDERHKIAATGGCGESSVVEALARAGYALCKVADGPSYDGYLLRRLREGEEVKGRYSVS